MVFSQTNMVGAWTTTTRGSHRGAHAEPQPGDDLSMSFQPTFPSRLSRICATRIEIIEAVDRLGDQVINIAGAGATNAQADWALIRNAVVPLQLVPAGVHPSDAGGTVPISCTPITARRLPALEDGAFAAG